MHIHNRDHITYRCKETMIHVKQHKTHVFQDEEYNNEDLSPVNWIPCTGISSGSGSGSGSSGSTYFSNSWSLKNVDNGHEISPQTSNNANFTLMQRL